MRRLSYIAIFRICAAIVLLFILSSQASSADFEDTVFYRTIEKYRIENDLLPSSLVDQSTHDYNIRVRRIPPWVIVPTYSNESSIDRSNTIVVIEEEQSVASGASGLASELAGFIVDRATHEILSRTLLEIREQLGDSYYSALMPNTMQLLRKIRELEPRTIAAAFRSAVVGDLQQFSSRLVAAHSNAPEHIETRIEMLGSVHRTLDLIASGVHPRLALPTLASRGYDGTCEALTLISIGTISRELMYDNRFVRMTVDGVPYEFSMDAILSLDLRIDGLDEGSAVRIAKILEDIRQTYWNDLLPTSKGGCLNTGSIAWLFEHLFLSLRRLDSLIASAGDGGVSAGDLVRPVVAAVRRLEIQAHRLARCEKSILTGNEICEEPAVPTMRPSLVHYYMEMYLAELERRYTDVVANALLVLDGATGEDGVVHLSSEHRFAERLIVLAGNLAAATHPSEIRSVLESVAEPVGSFAKKRRPGFYISFGSYVGLRAGIEHVSAADSTSSTAGEFMDNPELHAGIALPIGVEVGLGLGSRCCSLGLFLAPIDLGIVTDSRVPVITGNRTTNLGSDIAWTHFLTPSVYAVFGFPWDWPTAIAVGVQYAPSLRKEHGILFDAWQLSLMLGVDVTLFKF